MPSFNQFCVLACLLVAGCAAPSGPRPAAVLPQTEGLPIAFPATPAQAQAALGTPQPPEPFRELDPVSGRVVWQGLQMRVAARGVWLFWKPDGWLYTIRLDAPFAGSIGGVRIGDTRATLLARRGAMPPEKPRPGLSDDVRRVLEDQRRNSPYYNIEGEYTAAYAFGEGDVVRTIYLMPIRAALGR